tara:strand:+ start:389 stop:1264 length:876 start_codon:yes stop_codon:yes gene_type:complete
MAVIQTNQLDLFIASATDVSPKNHQDLMARCWFNLSKKKRTTPIEHNFKENWVKVTADEKYGIASIFDNDILIFAIAQLMAAVNDKRDTGRRIQFTGYEYLKFIGRKHLGGKAYKDIWSSLERLHHTFVETNIRMGSSKRHHSFNWLSEIKQVEENGVHRGYEIVLPEWLYSSVINDKMVLTLHPDYFTIKGGLERWLYLFARKSSGRQEYGWNENIRSIYSKSASIGSYSEFNRKLKTIVKKNSILGYDISTIKWQRELAINFIFSLGFTNENKIAKRRTNGAKQYRRIE